MEEMQTIAELAKKYDAYVVTDEVYEHIVYAPNKHIYMQSLEGMRERTIVCNSLSKTYSITGWRLGYVIANPQIIDRVKKVHDFLTVGAAAPLMEAAVVGLEFGDGYYDELAAHYAHMKEVFVGGLKKLGLKYTDPQGAYYVLVDVSEFGVKDDVKFCEWMAQFVGVAAVPGSSFFREDVHNLVRFHFAKQDESLKLQTCKDFEWLVVDDGSEDETSELFDKWLEEDVIEIAYFKKKNGGKHRAINFAASKAQGQLFFIVDSDDYLTLTAVEIICKEWEKVENKKQSVKVGLIRD